MRDNRDTAAPGVRPTIMPAPLRSRLVSPLITLVLAGSIAALMLVAAYQVRPTLDIAIGDAAHDGTLVHGFYGPERQPPQDGGVRYRWTHGEGEIVVPGIGRGPARVALTLNRAGNPVERVRVLANGGELHALALQPGFVVYTLDVPAAYLTSGNLTLTLQAATFSPPGDGRALGVIVSRVIVQPLGTGFVLPPARIAFALWVGVMGIALGLLIAGVGARWTVAGTTLAAGVLGFGLIVDRAFVTVDASGIIIGGAGMIVVAVLVRWGIPCICRWRGMIVTARDVCWLAALAGGIVALRLAGALHPAIAIIDLRFHLNRLGDVVDHHTLLLRILSTEAGGRQVLYSPAPYIALWPLTPFVRDRVLLLVLFAVGIDAARLCLLWGVARAVTGANRAANLTATTMAVMPVGWIVYSWGIYANIFAEGMLTILFAFLVLAYGELAGRHRWVWTAFFALVIGMTLLAHLGVLVLTAGVVTLYGLARLIEAVATRRRDEGRAFALFVTAGVLAAVLAFVLFYRIPAAELRSAVASVPANATAISAAVNAEPPLYRTGGATPDGRIGLDAVQTGNLAAAVALESWFTARAFFGGWPIIAALVGGVLLARWGGQCHRYPMPANEAERRAHLAWSAALTVGVWGAVAVVMLVVGLVARLYVRYPLYALPAVSLGTGIAFAALAQRGRWGQVVVAGLLLVTAVSSLLMWYDRIVYAFKPTV